MPALNNEQFEIAVELRKLSLSAPSTEAARLVLVEGMKGKDAAQVNGVKPPAVSSVVSKIRQVVALVNRMHEAGSILNSSAVQE